MTTLNNRLMTKREYTECLNLDATDIMDDLENATHDYICDAVAEYCDSACPIYYGDIWENAKEISSYIEQGIEEQMADISRGLESVFQVGYYMYYSEQVNDNMENIAYNVLCNYVNENREKYSYIKTVELEGLAEEIAEDFDWNSSFDDLRESFEDAILNL